MVILVNSLAYNLTDLSNANYWVIHFYVFPKSIKKETRDSSHVSEATLSSPIISN